MATDTMVYSGTLIVHECCSCGIAFALPKGLDESALRDHSVWFYCPLGHHQHYIGKTDAQQQRDRADRAERSAQYNRDRAAQAIRSRNAMKGQVTKIKNRVGKGVCPCCNRSFPQLSAHMESEHPEFTDA